MHAIRHCSPVEEEVSLSRVGRSEFSFIYLFHYRSYPRPIKRARPLRWPSVLHYYVRLRVRFYLIYFITSYLLTPVDHTYRRLYRFAVRIASSALQCPRTALSPFKASPCYCSGTRRLHSGSRSFFGCERSSLVQRPNSRFLTRSPDSFLF